MEIDPRHELEEIGDDQQVYTDDVIDDGEGDLDQEDIGTFDPDADDEDDDPSVFEDDTEIDDLPDVGEPDPDEVPELELLDEQEKS
jgi:hypothetical protein